VRQQRGSGAALNRGDDRLTFHGNDIGGMITEEPAVRLGPLNLRGP
jgi:hypothetical protein